MVLFPIAEDLEVPPTEYCLKILPFFKFLLGVEILLVMGSLVAKDLWGALSLYLIVLLGYCCLPGDRGINVSRCLYYSVLVIYCGVLNVIQSVVYFKKTKDPCCFLKGTPLNVEVAQAVRLLLPFVELLSAYVTWSMFKDCARVLEQIPLLNGRNPLGPVGGLGQGRNAGYYEAFDQREPGGTRRQGGPGGQGAGGSSSQQQTSFQAFQGQGHKLGH